MFLASLNTPANKYRNFSLTSECLLEQNSVPLLLKLYY